MQFRHVQAIDGKGALRGIAVDGAGNVYVGEINPSTVQEIPFGCSSPSCFVTLGGGYHRDLEATVAAHASVYEGLGEAYRRH